MVSAFASGDEGPLKETSRTHMQAIPDLRVPSSI
jgi:hypothetical protein